MVVTDDLGKNCVWRVVDENLISEGSRDSRRIVSEAGKDKHLFQEF